MPSSPSLISNLGLVCARSWDEARREFSQALAIAPNDGLSLTFLARIDAFVAAPPPQDWDGSWRLDQK